MYRVKNNLSLHVVIIVENIWEFSLHKKYKQKKNYYKTLITCFHSTLSIISAPGAELSVKGGRSREIY